MAKKKTDVVYMIASLLLLVGGLNWGLVGLFDFNLVEAIFGSIGWLMKMVYGLVGASALYMIYGLYLK